MTSKELPNKEESERRVLEVAKQIKLARQINRFKCSGGEDGCYACRPFESVLRGEAEFVGEDDYKADVYLVPTAKKEEEMVSVIL